MITFFLCSVSAIIGFWLGKPRPKGYTLEDVRDGINHYIIDLCETPYSLNPYSSNTNLYLVKVELNRILDKIRRETND